MNRDTQRSADGAVLPPPLATTTGTVPEQQLRMIEKSRQRSLSYGLKENDAPDFSHLGQADLALLKEQNRALCSYALPVMDSLYEQIVHTHSMVILTDIRGLVLHTVGDDDFLEKADKVAIRPGAAWSERSKGTNAIGTAIAEGMPTLVHGNEHYLNANHFLTCSAAPIYDQQGEMLGVLDVTGDHRSYQRHTMALVRMSAQMIENQLFSAAAGNAITLHFHSRPELIGTLMEGIAAFTPGGRFLSANRAAMFQLGLPLAALRTHTFSSLFNLPVSTLVDHYRMAAPGFLDLRLHNGARVSARAELRLDSKLLLHAPSPTEQGTPRAPAATKPQVRQRPPRLHELGTGDAKIAAAIDKLNKVLDRDITILLTGETGTGKDLFAQAIHQASAHAHGPFIAVNCASIPETLIESELFGYEDGAFTGARKDGSPGKILQASGGTLFLDEIGDMPLALQGRLLRVLQERSVVPLGGTREIAVNISLVCATNRKLHDLIAAGRFREDLYYRINGLVVKLPPLRERSDLESLIRRMIAAEGKGANYTIAPDVMQQFRRYAWPGNLRQLSNLLRTAVAMAGDKREIRLEHLSDDFLEERAGPASQQREEAVPPADAAKLAASQVAAIRRALAAHQGNISATAKTLGISRNTIYRKLNLR
jgi:sigma-54 dependent transcriptional regulator, acetoin dehydrogenase operon transcriptional activator AcoR